MKKDDSPKQTILGGAVKGIAGIAISVFWRTPQESLFA